MSDESEGKRLVKFSVKFLIFSILWIGYLLVEQVHIEEWYKAIFICTFVMTIYFVLPLFQYATYLYITMVMMLFLSDLYFLSGKNAFVELLILFLQIDAVQNLKTKNYFLFLIISVLLTILLLYVDQVWEIEWFIGFSFFCLMSIWTNRILFQYEEKRILYEELLSEYRKLKRMQFEQENIVRQQERTRIARDIHDSVGHKLTALLMQLDMLKMENPSKLSQI